jgi:hypothetical protein
MDPGQLQYDTNQKCNQPSHGHHPPPLQSTCLVPMPQCTVRRITPGLVLCYFTVCTVIDLLQRSGARVVSGVISQNI